MVHSTNISYALQVAGGTNHTHQPLRTQQPRSINATGSLLIVLRGGTFRKNHSTRGVPKLHATRCLVK